MDPQLPTTTGLIPEIRRARVRVSKLKTLEARSELVNNVYPLLEMMAEMFGQVSMDHEERMAQAEIAIAELATSADSIVLPELADSIQDVLELALRVCSLAETLAAGPDSDGEQYAAAMGEVTDLIAKFRTDTKALRNELDEVTVDDSDDDGDGDEDGNDDGE